MDSSLRVRGASATEVSRLDKDLPVAAALSEMERLQSRMEAITSKIREFDDLLNGARPRPAGVDVNAHNSGGGIHNSLANLLNTFLELENAFHALVTGKD